MDHDKTTSHTPHSSVDSKVVSLRAYRRAHGLRQYCADKWVKGHKCAPTIQLHVMQELWDMLTPDKDESDGEFEDSAEQFMILLSQEVISATTSSTSFRFQGCIQGVQLVILLDSGSTHSFLDSTKAAAMVEVTPLDHPLTIKVANGSLLSCTSEIHNAEWSEQGLIYHSSFKIVPLPCYDAIVGMDWLERFSPMYIDWKHEWMTLPHMGQSVILHGITHLVPSGTVLEVRQIVEQSSENSKLCSLCALPVPESVRTLLDSYSSLFEPPVSLPPSRFCDHSIPLIEGACPVHVRPYRFSPLMKDEVEYQISEMLCTGLIQQSTGSFSSCWTPK